MFRIVEVDGHIKAYICTDNKADKYGTPKDFKTHKDAEAWIERRTRNYTPSWKYEIVEVE